MNYLKNAFFVLRLTKNLKAVNEKLKQKIEKKNTLKSQKNQFSAIFIFFKFGYAYKKKNKARKKCKSRT